MIKIESIHISKEAPHGDVKLWGKPTSKGVILMLLNKGKWQPMIMEGENAEVNLSEYLKASEIEAEYVAKDDADKTYVTKTEFNSIKEEINDSLTADVSNEILLLTKI